MQNPFVAVFVFIIILFFYIHITSQWTTSDDLEIYESEFESPANLQEVCSVKQPVVFKFAQTQIAAPFFERFQVAKFEKHDNIDIRIKDRTDYNLQDKESQDTAVDFVPVSFRSGRRLMTTDTNAKYFSENNSAFLEESGLDRISAILDPLLKPPLSAYTKHDILFGSPLLNTPLRYYLESHHFLAVTRGKIRVKLCPPKYGKILPQIKDYENYEFRTPVNPWSTNPNNAHREILQKIKFLDVEVNSGDVLFLPPYWWYSISFSGDPQTTVASFTYDVIMNVLAQSKHWSTYYLQQNNIKSKPAKTILSALDDVEIADDSRAPYLEKSQEFEKTQTKEIVTNAGTYVTNGQSS